jgi:hypothetical protein
MREHMLLLASEPLNLANFIEDDALQFHPFTRK